MTSQYCFLICYPVFFALFRSSKGKILHLVHFSTDDSFPLNGVPFPFQLQPFVLAIIVISSFLFSLQLQKETILCSGNVLSFLSPIHPSSFGKAFHKLSISWKTEEFCPSGQLRADGRDVVLVTEVCYDWSVSWLKKESIQHWVRHSSVPMCMRLSWFFFLLLQTKLMWSCLFAASQRCIYIFAKVWKRYENCSRSLINPFLFFRVFDIRRRCSDLLSIFIPFDASIYSTLCVIFSTRVLVSKHNQRQTLLFVNNAFDYHLKPMHFIR